MKCPSCGTEILDDDIQVNGFLKDDESEVATIKEGCLDIQLVCPNAECEKTMSSFIKDADWTVD